MSSGLFKSPQGKSSHDTWQDITKPTTGRAMALSLLWAMRQRAEAELPKEVGPGQGRG